jgi:hypothetical protein
MQRSAEQQFDSEKVVKDLEGTLFECKPILRSVWSELSEQVRFDLFELHVPDLAHSYRVAIKAATPHYKERPWPRRE